MSMTEGEAKEKWCPFSRTSERHSDGGITGVRNRMVYVERSREFEGERISEVRLAGTNCIASACMAWRWSSKGGAQTPREQWSGYCGAFGKGAS